MSISTHVLDTSKGKPAAGVAVRLERRDGSRWTELSRGTTNTDGRVAALLADGAAAPGGSYRLTFDVGAYFAGFGVESFYGEVTIDFMIRDTAAHYHVPLLVSPFGYSTYRGS